MCGGGPPPGTSCDSTALTTPPVSRPWMRMTIGMPRTFIFLPPSDGIWIGFINIGGDVLLSCADWQDFVLSLSGRMLILRYEGEKSPPRGDSHFLWSVNERLLHG